jgi:hypothetical protein
VVFICHGPAIVVKEQGGAIPHVQREFRIASVCWADQPTTIGGVDCPENAVIRGDDGVGCDHLVGRVGSFAVVGGAHLIGVQTIGDAVVHVCDEVFTTVNKFIVQDILGAFCQ